tara:strand:+ start:126 stop:1307 length:1182 start_codon:yes stop_codon:yes gene_type:complete
LQINPRKGKGTGAEKGVGVKLYSDFYTSDIIVASPLGLRLVGEKNKKNSASDSGEAFNFLSSIEVLYIHRADVLYMQNWEHLEYILNHCNKMPQGNLDNSVPGGVDFSRIRGYFLNNESVSHRQTIVTSHFNIAEIQAILRMHSSSWSGALSINYAKHDGVLEQAPAGLTQMFQYIHTSSYETQNSERFEFFKSNLLSQIIRLEQKHTLIIVPSYFDFVRIRNELIRQEVSAVFVHEYSRESEINRGRSRFFHGQRSILVYSGRAHFYRRFKLRGARHIVLYSLPEYNHFYSEFLNMIEDVNLDVNSYKSVNNAGSNSHDNSHSNSSSTTSSTAVSVDQSTSATVLFTMFERLQLERIVGHKRANYMLNDSTGSSSTSIKSSSIQQNKVFMFS